MFQWFNAQALYRILTDTHEGISERIVIQVDVFIFVVLSSCFGNGSLCVCDSNYNFSKNDLNANFTKNFEVMEY
jgi:hypothetical protein